MVKFYVYHCLVGVIPIFIIFEDIFLTCTLLVFGCLLKPLNNGF